MDKKTISVVTATYNASKDIARLIASLQSQTDSEFAWVVSDGGSSDETVEMVKAAKDLNVVLLEDPDFGIFDALNQAVKACDTEYYIVMGADDYFYDDAIENFKNKMSNTSDVIAAKFKAGDRIVSKRKGSYTLYGQSSFVAGHAVGSAFRTDLHKKYGFYSNKYPIAADQHFILSACAEGDAQVVDADFVAGEYAEDGLSGTDIVGALVEVFRIQLDFKSNFFFQLMMLNLRLMKMLITRR